MIINKINLWRKSILLRITNSLKQESSSKTSLQINPLEVKRILVVRPNHRLGNLLLVSALIKELEATFMNATIDLVAKGGLAKIIYKNYDSIGQIYQLPKRPFKHPVTYLSLFSKIKKRPYDLAINAVSNSSSGRIFTSFSNATIKILGDEGNDRLSINQPAGYGHIAKHQIYHLRRFLK